MGHKGCDGVDSSEEKLAGAEKDGRHLLFKFNEVCSNLSMFELIVMAFSGLVPSSTRIIIIWEYFERNMVEM